MKKTIACLLPLFFLLLSVNAQTPEILSWMQNTTGATGYNNITSDVQTVQYSATQVYVSCTCIPGYSIGPWNSNPNTPVNQNFVYKITRTPVQNMSTPIVTALGHIGVWSNGVSVFNAKDGMSYNNAGVWNRNAYYYEAISFDNCLGHPAPNGEYHNHVNPTCVYDDADSINHSPIIGYAFDGFPIYGAYAYTNTNGTGPVKRMKSSYVLSSNTTRTNGPAISATYPAGCYIEDYVYSAAAGDLDVHNGRFCVTPDYPAGTYCYFVTIDAQLNPVYPFVLGPTYYGTVPAGNTGPNGGHNTISETTTVFVPATAVSEIANATISFTVLPNPVEDYAFIYVGAESKNNLSGKLFSANGQLLQTINFMQPSIAYSIDMRNYPAGIYFLTLDSGNALLTKKIIKQ
ncbi:hypothetical protein BH11BAC7_BH11BAC7_05440 [soil metagenome]